MADMVSILIPSDKPRSFSEAFGLREIRRDIKVGAIPRPLRMTLPSLLLE